MSAHSTLRDRRRQQTEREIQSATLRLALRDGHEAITTEMIALEAGISLRTFFNYFPNKQAALVGRPPQIQAETRDLFLRSSGPLMEDLYQTLGRFLDDSHLSRDTTRMIDTLLARSPELVPGFYASLQMLTDQLAGMIALRHNDVPAEVAEMTAELVTHGLANSFRLWSQHDSMAKDQIVTLTRSQVDRVRMLLDR